MAVERLTDYTRRIWTALDADAPEGHDFQVNDVIYYMDSSQCGIVTYVYPEGSIDVEFLPDVGGGGGGGVDFSDIAQPMNLHNIGYLFDALQNGRWDCIEFTVLSGTTPIVVDFGRKMAGYLVYPKTLDVATNETDTTQHTRLSLSFRNIVEGDTNPAVWAVNRTRASANLQVAASGTVFQGGSTTTANNIMTFTPNDPADTLRNPFVFNTPYIALYWW